MQDKSTPWRVWSGDVWLVFPWHFTHRAQVHYYSPCLVFRQCPQPSARVPKASCGKLSGLPMLCLQLSIHS